ncbi:MAG: hypothetical protein E7033_05625 [Akkermansiaceae bacterium]|nr:hypothetical protein [Akkermansiaceae bacterium]
MEPADEDLTDIETQLRELAAQDRARPEDADLLARLMQQADAAFGSPRRRRRFPWLQVSALVAGVAVLATVPFWWFGQEAPIAAGSAENPPAAGAAAAPVLAVAELAPAGDALPQAACGMPADAVAQLYGEAKAEAAAEPEPADSNWGDVVRDLAVAVYSGAAEEDAEMDDAEIPPWLCETESAAAPESLAVARATPAVSPQAMKQRVCGGMPEGAAYLKSINGKAKRAMAPAAQSPAALPPALKAYAAQIRARAKRAQH